MRCFKKMLGFIKKNKTVNKQPSENKKVESDQLNYSITEVMESSNETDDVSDELIAVITAAIAASLNRSTYSVVVRSIRQVQTTSPAWNRAARLDLTTSRLY